MHIGKATLSIRVLALTNAILDTLLLTLLGIFASQGVGIPIVDLLGSLFLGYDATIPGILLGACWGFVFGGVVGAAFAWFYNKML